MPNLKGIEEVVSSEDLRRLDHIKIADALVVVADVATNAYDHLVLTLGIVGKNVVKSRNKMTLIIPKKVQVTRIS